MLPDPGLELDELVFTEGPPGVVLLDPDWDVDPPDLSDVAEVDPFELLDPYLAVEELVLAV